MSDAQWYVVHTYSGYENKVKVDIEKTIENRGLQDQILEVSVPMEEVIELKNGDGSTHYDYFGHPHYHVVCDNCGKISDVFDEHFSEITKELQAMSREKTGYLVTGCHIEVHGICPDCQRKLHLNNH